MFNSIEMNIVEQEQVNPGKDVTQKSQPKIDLTIRIIFLKTRRKINEMCET